MTRLRVGFDLDGCLYNFGDCVREYLEYTGQGHIWKSGPTPKPFWEFYKDWGWTTEQFVEFCNAGADAGFIFSGDARPGASQAVQKVASLGHEIVIITDRQFGTHPKVSHKATEEWLRYHDIPYDELWFSADKTCAPTDVFVEDKWQNFIALNEAGTTCYLINRPWNIDYGPHHLRIDDISDYADIVQGLTQSSMV